MSDRLKFLKGLQALLEKPEKSVIKEPVISGLKPASAPVNPHWDEDRYQVELPTGGRSARKLDGRHYGDIESKAAKGLDKTRHELEWDIMWAALQFWDDHKQVLTLEQPLQYKYLVNELGRHQILPDEIPDILERVYRRIRRVKFQMLMAGLKAALIGVMLLLCIGRGTYGFVHFLLEPARAAPVVQAPGMEYLWIENHFPFWIGPAKPEVIQRYWLHYVDRYPDDDCITVEPAKGKWIGCYKPK